SEIRAPMAVAVIGGLIVATVLSLLVVPSFYLVADRIAERIRGRGEEETPDSASPEPSPSEPSPSAP
ncbi:MAG TPA: efflux RND transporter permease subunit, partial [Thermoanaerobaculia bacterium]|nr:efflux RND transporter permease subunit [Thermoanaerobaculia bacterium]